MTALTLTVLGVPQAKGSMRAYVPKGATHPILTSSNRNLKDWETLVRGEVQRAIVTVDDTTRKKLFWSPLAVTLIFHVLRPKSTSKKILWPTTRPDIDKFCRAMLDACSGVIYADDAHVTTLVARKVYTEFYPRVDLKFEYEGASVATFTEAQYELTESTIAGA